jgi:hypothetical protein
MLYAIIALLVASFLCLGVAFIAALTGMGPWSSPLLSDDTISRLVKLALVFFLSIAPLLIWHFIDPSL